MPERRFGRSIKTTDAEERLLADHHEAPAVADDASASARAAAELGRPRSSTVGSEGRRLRLASNDGRDASAGPIAVADGFDVDSSFLALRAGDHRPSRLRPQRFVDGGDRRLGGFLQPSVAEGARRAIMTG